MSDTAAAAPSVSGPAERGDEGPEGGLAVLGVVAFLELGAFSRLAADAALAPDLHQRLELSRMAGDSLQRLDRVERRIGELGGTLEPVMSPYAGVLREFDARTVPQTWWERLLKAYVGYGVADDFCRVLAQASDATTRTVVEEALEDEPHTRLIVGALAAAVATDRTLASRLALWGRRLVGEAMGAAQRMLAEHPELRGLLERSCDAAEPDAQARLFSTLTAEHSRRMDRLGLAA